jgi:CheY-like chemotaxis protein
MLPSIEPDVFKDWKIVLVDDDPFSLDIMSSLLQHFGAKISKATNGQEGLATIKSVRPDFVITDLSMPLMDGWALVDKLKEDRATAEVPVIALTAHAMKGHREKAMAKGFHNYLTKPIMPQTFMEDLVRLLIDMPALAEKLAG